MQAKKNWEIVLNSLKEYYKGSAFDGYLKNMRFLEKKGKDIYIGVYSEFIKEKIIKKYQDLILEMIRDVSNWRDVEQIHFIVDKRFDIEIDDTEENDINIEDIKNKDDTGLNPKYKFENFLVGKSNEFAHAVALAVANNPGKEHNPLFIYGNTGLGKTHLMQAIAYKILENNPEMKVKYVTTERFTGEFIDKVKSQEGNEFKKKYRNVDVLLIDDIQFLSKAERTQEEFFHTFNELFNRNKQIVISSDRPPGMLMGVKERLVSRFESGMIADIQEPDFELRVAILKHEAEKKNIKISDEVLSYIAKKIISNIRKLEGAFIRVCAYANFHNLEVTPRLIDSVLREMLITNQKKITIPDIQRAVADYFKIKLSEIINKRRSQNIAFPRQIAMYLSRELTNESLVSIGKAFGGRDHTTVRHACEKIVKMLKTDLELKEELDNIIRKINS